MYSEAQTDPMALPSAEGSDAGMPAIESYSPAPDMPARSSTFAEDRTMTVASFWKALPACRGQRLITKESLLPDEVSAVEFAGQNDMEAYAYFQVIPVVVVASGVGNSILSR